jgi:cardiolipin synthase
MGLAPLLVVLVLAREMRWALGVFVLAGLTDVLDGLAARWSGQGTALGAMLDPVADKILLT